MKQWYEKLFENYGETYDKESFTHGTLGEVDFLEQEMQSNKNLRVLDVGCGTGRHAIELTKRGYQVVGIDLSDSQLAKAKAKASQEGLEIPFLKADARTLPFHQEFDVAIMICEGAFPLMETDQMNFEILQSVANALKSKGLFIFTTLNGLFPITHSLQVDEEEEQGGSHFDFHNFDWLTMRSHSTATVQDDSGQIQTMEVDERFYLPSEIHWLLSTLGFQSIEFFGAKLGAFSRQDALTPDDFEMLVIAKKS